jgi:hypothetical protein
MRRPGVIALDVNVQEISKIAGGVLALVMSIPMVISIVRENGAGQSFATWILWTALNSILTVSVIEQHGNFLLLLGFTVGAAASAAVLLWKGRFAWGRFETVVLILVLTCVLVWAASGSKLATIAATAASCIAGMPGMLALWRSPQPKIGNIWLGFAIANALSFFGGTTMTVEEKLAPGVFTISALLMVAVSRGRHRKVTCQNQTMA